MNLQSQSMPKKMEFLGTILITRSIIGALATMMEQACGLSITQTIVKLVPKHPIRTTPNHPKLMPMLQRWCQGQDLSWFWLTLLKQILLLLLPDDVGLTFQVFFQLCNLLNFPCGIKIEKRLHHHMWPRESN